MESKLLTKILASGDILDNQKYIASDSILRNRRLGEIKVKNPHGLNQASFHRNVFKFLAKDVVGINEKIINKKSDIVLFGKKEYEHNTDDPLIRFSGADREKFTLITGNVIGEITKGEYKLKINSRFGDEFLRYIIADADGFLEIDDVGSITKDSSFDWLLYHLWITKLRKAYRLGIPKNYVNKQEELTYLRGNVDLVKYYQNPDSATLDCRYKSLSHENEATRLIAMVFKQNERNSFLQKEINLKSAFYIASQGNYIRPNEIDRVKPFSNPYYHPYNEVLMLSKLILEKGGLGFGGNKKDRAFLFDVSMLFEYFVKKLFTRSGLNVLDKSLQLCEIPKGGRYSHKLQPDIVVEHNGSFSIFDVKYKWFDSRFGAKREDLFQLHTYIGQYANRGELTAAGLIYPVSQEDFLKMDNGIFIKESFRFGGNSSEIDFYILFVVVPKETSFLEFATAFKENNEKFQKHILKITS